jgi:hypothetical protein
MYIGHPESKTVCTKHTVGMAHAVAYLVEALCCKPDGRGFDSKC